MQRDALVLDTHGRHAQAVAFSADGEWLVTTGMDAMIRLWRLPDFRPAATVGGHRKSVKSVVLYPDGGRIATCSSDGTARVWSFPDGRPLHTLVGQSRPQWSPDGRLLTTLSSPGRVAHWDGESCESLGEFAVADRRLFCLVFAPHEDELLIGGTGPIHRVRLHDGAPLGLLTGHGAAIAALAISPDRSLLASTGAEGELRLWDTGSWQVVHEAPLRASGVLQVAWLPASDRIAVACDHEIQILSVRAGDPVERLEAPIKGLYGVAVSPEGRWLANAGADGRIRIWRLAE
jgi:WD40 repeat protein